jgi:hypothetical protein
VVVSEDSVAVLVPVPDVASTAARFLLRSRRDGVEEWTGKSLPFEIHPSPLHSPPTVVLADGDLWVTSETVPTAELDPDAGEGSFSALWHTQDIESGNSTPAPAAPSEATGRLPENVPQDTRIAQPTLFKNSAFSTPLRN